MGEVVRRVEIGVLASGTVVSHRSRLSNGLLEKLGIEWMLTNHL